MDRLLVPILVFIPPVVLPIVFLVCLYYALGQAKYAKHNNTKPSYQNDYTEPEVTWDSVRDETAEMKEAWKDGNISETIMEFFDVLNSLIKHFIVSNFNEAIYTNPIIWFCVAPLVFPVACKLALRYAEGDCIRNHRNKNKKINHTCSHNRKGKMNIYFACSVRSGDRSNAKAMIDILKRYGNVLTEHLGLENPDADFAETDKDIFKKDVNLLNKADIFIADCNNPSHGVGFMTAYALGKNIPVHCFVNDDANLSAMLNGCPDVRRHSFKHNDSGIDFKDFDSIVRSVIYQQIKKTFNPNGQPNSFIFIGPAGSGKSTMAKKLAERYDYVHISTGQLLRDLPKENKNYDTVQKLIKDGQMVPADIMIDILVERLKCDDVKSRGYVLDGYPQSGEDYKLFEKVLYTVDKYGDRNFIGYGLKIVYQFDCSEDVCVERQCSRAERESDNETTARKRYKDYCEKMPDCPHNLKVDEAFEKNLVVSVNAEKSMEDVWKDVMTTHDNVCYPNFDYCHNSYMMVCDSQPRQSDQFHFHIDAESHESLWEICMGLLKAYPKHSRNLKNYPIRDLKLGNQSQTHGAYSIMQNFHEINNQGGVNEAFATCPIEEPTKNIRFFEDFTSALKIAYAHALVTGEKTMVELEEYIYETQFLGGKFANEKQWFTDKNTVFESIKMCYPEYYNKDTPPIEFHHGFDIPKEKYPEEPFSSQEFIDYCKSRDIDFGGCFIFDNDKVWKYRTNEFMTPKCDKYLDISAGPKCVESMRRMINVLQKQTKVIHQFLQDKNIYDKDKFIWINSSIEIVHGIWNFNNVKA